MRRCHTTHDFEQRLRMARITPTARRKHILETLHKRGALSADALVACMGVAAHRVTVYRTLAQLQKAGVLTVRDVAGAAQYELTDHHTHTITCRTCGREEILAQCLFEETEMLACGASKLFDRIDTHTVSFFGYCKRCRV